LIAKRFSHSSQRREIRFFQKIGFLIKVIGLIGMSFSRSSQRREKFFSLKLEKRNPIFPKNRISYQSYRIDRHEFFSLKPEKSKKVGHAIGLIGKSFSRSSQRREEKSDFSKK
jgi:hypothetical protein